MDRLVAHCAVFAAFGAASPAPDSQAGAHAFRFFQGTIEIGNEVYRWTGSTLDATVDVPALGHRVVTRTRYDPTWSPIEYTAAVFQLATGEEIQNVRVSFGADSVSWVTTGQGANSGSRPLTNPRGVLQNLVFSHIEALLRRPAIGPNGSETIHVFLVDNGQPLDATVARTGSTGTLTIAGSNADFTVSPDGRLASFTNAAQALRVESVPAESVSAARPLAPTAAPPPPTGVVEEPFEWSNGPQRLAGTLTRPAGSAAVPVALIIAGSGPTDRDGNSPLGVKSDLYKKLAWALAARGVASVRYDKRGLGGSSATASAEPVTFDDFADDASAAAKALSADHRFAKVFLIGHSEGAGLATRAANRGAPVAGVVMMAGLGRGFRTVLHEQLARQLDAAQIAEFDRTMDAYLGDGPMPEVPAALRTLFPPSARRFVQTAVAIDPADEARRTPVPLLVVQGTTDIQVAVADAEKLRAARPSARVLIIPAANHLFVGVESTAPAAQATSYQDPTLPLVPELIPALIEFILGRTP